MPLFTHNLAPALAKHPGVKAAFDKRLPQAREALTHWRTSQNPNFAAVRRSIENTDDLAQAAELVEHLTKNTTELLLLGIGGSSLGAQTLAQLAFWGTEAYTPRPNHPRLHIIDGIDSAVFRTLLNMLDLRTTRFLVVSKSGGTTETLMQLLVAIEALEEAGGGKYLKHHFAGIAEEGSNPLRAILTDMGAPMMAHDADLNGRYSAFSPVGLVPALIAGLDARAIRAGAREMFDAAMTGEAPAIDGGALSVAARDAGLSQSVMWVYRDRLARLPKWWRQLWAESLGKNGQGTTPIDAQGPVDQHSQLQLYLDGPNDKLFTLVDAPAVSEAKANVAWAQKHGLDLLAGRGLSEVVAAELRATAETLSNAGRAVRRISLASPLEERNMGALMMHFVLETLIAARLWNVDPFGQPAVEEGKRLTRKYLEAQG
ncbi:MAG: glucose-6-phosphate isomerase [Alphaproteobacteria bacterium]|nr:glucose-6-phosphate isomerase [Alphaproteobacteria bacterium]